MFSVTVTVHISKNAQNELFCVLRPRTLNINLRRFDPVDVGGRGVAGQRVPGASAQVIPATGALGTPTSTPCSVSFFLMLL